MVLSEPLSRLSSQALRLQASVEAIRKNDNVEIDRRKAELVESIDAARIRLGNELVDARDQRQSDKADEEVNISESFEVLKRLRAPRQARSRGLSSPRDAQDIEADVLEDIEFAIYAVQEAEYSILDAVTARFSFSDG